VIYTVECQLSELQSSKRISYPNTKNQAVAHANLDSFLTL